MFQMGQMEIFSGALFNNSGFNMATQLAPPLRRSKRSPDLLFSHSVWRELSLHRPTKVALK